MKKNTAYFVSYLLFLIIIASFVGNEALLMNKNGTLIQQPISTNERIEDAVASSMIDDWSMYGHDAAHTGYSTSTPPDTNETVFTRSVEGYSRGVSVANRRIYVPTQASLTSGHLSCYNASTGALIFDYTNQSFSPFVPAVDGEKLYVSSMLGNVSCLNALTGVHLWTYPTGDLCYCPPTLAYGNVYVPSSTRMVCVDAQKGSLVWEYATGDIVYSSPAVVERKVYFISDDDFIYCVNATNGNLTWKYPINIDTTWNPSPCVVNGKVYVGTNNLAHTLSGTGYYNSSSFYCLNASTGTFLWKFQLEEWNYFVGIPAVHDNRIFISSPNLLYCLNATSGKQLWNLSITGFFDSPSNPAVTERSVYIIDISFVYCLNVETGAVRWAYPINNPAGESGLAISDNIVYATSGSMMYAFGETPGNSPPDPPSLPQGPTLGVVNTSYIYTAQTTDPNDDVIAYRFDWGDGTMSDWTLFVPSETPVNISHRWSAANTYHVRVKAKDIHNKETTWSSALPVTIIEESAEQLVLSVNPMIVPEGTEFTVTVNLKNNPVENAEVKFDDQVKKTDVNGNAVFTASEVTSDTPYSIIATYQQYPVATTTVTILDTSPPPTGFLFGVITDSSGLLLADVHVTLSSGTNTKTVPSDSTGKYNIAAPAGLYTMIVSTSGYLPRTFSNVQVVANTAIEKQVTLILQKPTPVPTTGDVAEAFLQEKTLEGAIGAQVIISAGQAPQVSSYSNDLTLQVTSSKEIIRFTVNAEQDIGTILVIWIEKYGVLSDLDHLAVTFDATPVPEETDSQTFFDPMHQSEPAWLPVQTPTGLYVCVRISHFSTHTITISSITEGTLPLLIYGAVCSIAAVLFLSRFYMRPLMLIYFHRKKL